MALNYYAVGGCKTFSQCFAWDRAVRKAILKYEKEKNERMSLQEDGIVLVVMSRSCCCVMVELRKLGTKGVVAEER